MGRPSVPVERDRLLDAAESEFAEQGFQGARLRSIAERVGVTAGSLYHHCSGKDDLYRAVLERAFERAAPAILARPRASDPLDDIHALLRAAMEELARRPTVAALIFQALAAAPSSEQLGFEARRLEALTVVIEPLMRGIQQGRFVIPDLRVTLVQILALLTFPFVAHRSVLPILGDSERFDADTLERLWDGTRRTLDAMLGVQKSDASR
jgi:TetR/AcrR family transcriptional regulator